MCNIPKNRSNIAASILQNPEMLEDVYEASKDSAGSAQQELDKYLDSITGKVTKLQNAIQQLSFNVIDSEPLKVIIDLLTGAVKLVNTLVENIGSLNLVIGGAAGILTTKFGKGFFQYTKEDGLNIGPKILASIKDARKPIINEIKGLAEQYTDEFLVSDLDNSVFSSLSTNAQNAIENTKKVKGEMTSLGDVISSLEHPIMGVGGALSKAGGMLSTFMQTLGNIAISILASMAAGLVIKTIADIITYQDRLIEKGKEAKDTISDTFKDFKDQTSSFEDMQVSLGIEVEEDQDVEDTIKNIADKYSELHEGVNGFTNENINLTNDEYQQYLDTCNKLAEQYPSLVKGWDSQGNAILNIGTSADEARAALMRMYDAQQLSANMEIGDNLDDLYKGVSAEVGKLDKQNKKLNEKNSDLEEKINWKNDNTILDLSGYTLTVSPSEQMNVAIKNAVNDTMGPNAYDTLAESAWFDPSNNTVVYYLDQLEGLTETRMEQIRERINNIDLSSDEKVKMSENAQQIRANELKKQDLWASVEGSVSQWLQTSKTFTGFNEKIQSAVLGNLGNINLDNLDNGNYETVLDFVYGEILTPIDGLNEEVQEKIAEAFTIDTSKINQQDYYSTIKGIFVDQFGVDADKWMDLLGFNGIFDEVVNETSAIFDEFGDNLTDEQIATIRGLSVDKIRKGYSLIREKSYKPEGFGEFIRDLDKKPKKAPGVGTLTDILNDDGYSKEASTFTSNLSEIKTAMEQVGQSGSVASEEVTKLLETGMKFDNFELSGLSKTGTEVLGEWIKRLYEMADAMDLSDDGMKDLAQYVESIVSSYDDLVDIDPQRFITNVISNTPFSKGGSSTVNQIVSQINAGLGDRLQSENASEILLLLKADGTLASGQIQQIVDKWDHYEIELEITADAEEFERRAAQAARDAAKQSYEETSNSLKEAFGDTLTQDDYWGIIGLNTSQMLSKSAEVNDLKAFRDGIKNKNSKEYYEADTNYWNSMTDLMNLRLKGQEAFKAQQEAGAAEINRSIEEMQNTRSALEAQVTEATNQGLKAGPGTYYKLQSVTKNMAQQQRDLYDYWMEKASKTSNQSWALEWTKNAQDALNEAMQLESDSLNYLMQPTQDMIDELGVSMNGLQTEATNIQSIMSSREAKGIKPIVKDYNRLIKNSKQQIKNLNDQNKLLQRQQTYLNQGSDKWREIQDQIESNKQSIREMVDSQYEWGQNMTMSAITNTSNLLSQLQSAANTGHMDSSSLQELISMARGNADDILTTTTTGSYADPQAIRELYEQYSELGLSIVNTQMAAEQLDFSNNEKEMLRLGKSLDPTIENINDLHRAMAQNPDNPDYAKIFDLDEENQGILQTITNLQSLEEEILANSSALGQYQAALSSANWSDPMQTIRGGMESADKLYDQGWWGKDDFTSYAQLIATNEQLQDKTGWAAIEAYEENREAVKRYLTEDATGVDNWVDDMISKSKELGEEWATLDEQGNYTFNIDDMEKFATAMGRSTEFAEYMLMAMKDANYDIDISRIDDEFSRTFNNISGTEANAAQQVKNLVTEMQNVALAGGDISQGAEAAGAALMRMREAGVSDDVINSLVEELNLLGEFNGFHIDPKTLEVTTTVDTNEIDEVDENISKPRRLMVEYGVEEDSVKEAHNTIMSHWKGNEENIRYATKALSDYTAEELLAIKHNDGAWSDGEKELEDFAKSLGFTTDQCNALVVALEQMGMLKIVPDSADDAISELSKLNQLKIDYGINDGEIKSATGAIDKAFNGNRQNIAEATQTLRDYTAAELLAIDHNDHAWSDGEKEIESFAETLGLPLDQVNALIIALEQMGMLKPEVEAEVDTSDAETGVETLREKLAKPFKAIVEVATESEPIQNIKEKIKEKLQTGIENVKLELQQKEAEKQYAPLIDATQEIPDAISDASDTITSAISDGASSVVSAINGGGNNGPGDNNGPGGTNGTTTYSSTTTGKSQHTGASSNASGTANNSKGSSNNNGKSSGGSSAGAPIQSSPIDYSVLPTQQVVDVSYVPNVQQVENTNEEIEEKPVEQEVELVNKGKGSPFVGDQTTTLTTETDTSGALSSLKEVASAAAGLGGKTIQFNGDSSKLVAEAGKGTAAINKIPNSHNTNITATDNASGPAQRIKDAIAGIKSKVVSIVAKVSGESGVSNLATKIAGLASKTVNVVSNFITNTIHNKLGFGGGTAYSSGTTLGHGYANGTAQDWTVGKDEDALTNEVGQESIVRDGKWMLLPGGPHVEKLKKDDIVY